MRLTATHENTTRLAALIAARLPGALDALHDALPGFPATVPGSGSVGGGGGGGGGSPTSVVERLAGKPDRATAAQSEICAIVRRMARDAARLDQLVTSWATTTHERPSAGSGDANWCSSCLRVQAFSSVHRAGLCWYCYGNRLEDGTPPSLAMVKAKAQRSTRGR